MLKTAGLSVSAIFLIVLVAVERVGAQPLPYESRARFLAAPGAEVADVLGVTEANAPGGVDSLLRSVQTPVEWFFGVTPSVRWSTNPHVQGASAHPTVGIILSRSQAMRLQSTLDTRSLEDALRFVLAHEFAHMAQFKAYSQESVGDSAKTRPVECQADIWASMAVSNIMVDAGLPLETAMERMYAAVAAAFEVGHPAWDDPTKHPRSDQRIACAAMGISAGLHLRLVRAYEATGNPNLLAQINEWKSVDERWFGPGDDVWAWTNETAKALTNFEGRRFDLVGGPVDFIDIYSRMASAAEQGADAMREEQSFRAFPAPTVCTFEQGDDESSITCVDTYFASAAIARWSFDNQVGMLRWALVSQRGWTEVSGESRVQFYNGRASAEAHIEDSPRRVTVRFSHSTER